MEGGATSMGGSTPDGPVPSEEPRVPEGPHVVSPAASLSTRGRTPSYLQSQLSTGGTCTSPWAGCFLGI